MFRNSRDTLGRNSRDTSGRNSRDNSGRNSRDTLFVILVILRFVYNSRYT